MIMVHLKKCELILQFDCTNIIFADCKIIWSDGKADACFTKRHKGWKMSLYKILSNNHKTLTF